MSGTTELAAPKIDSPLLEFWRRFRRKKLALFAGGVILLIVLAALFAPFVAPYDPAAPDYENVLSDPTASHWLGTDSYGRDVLSRIIWGARISLSVGFILL